MSYQLNNKIKNLTPYEPISGTYQIRLDANESFFQIDEAFLADALKVPYNRYPDPFAADLCKAFAEQYHLNPNNITAGNGSDELISLIAGAFFENGDTLLTLQNDFSMYRFYGEVFGIQTKVYPKCEDLTIDVDGLISYINENKIAGLVFSNPCNPTSLCLNREDVLKIINGVNALVVVDEAYMDFSNQSILDVCCDFDNVIVLKTCSKAIGMAAIRLGFAIANDTITTALRAVKSPYNVNSVTQKIGEIILKRSDYLKECIKQIIENRDELYQAMCLLSEEFPVFETVYKTQTNFVFIKTKQAKQIFDKLLENSIAIRFMGDYLRITTGTKEENTQLLKILRTILQ